MIRSKRGVGERQRERVAVDLAARERRRHLAGLDHRADDVPDVVAARRVVVERDDGRAAPHGLERVPPAAAAHVEQALAGAEVEAIEVDGQHQRAPACSSSSAR